MLRCGSQPKKSVRQADFLLTGRVRLQIVGCMKTGLRLEGTSADNMGVEQCHILIKDLEAQKKASASGGLNGEPGATTAEDVGEAEGDNETADAVTSGTTGLVGQHEMEDTARTTAGSKIEAVLNKFNYFESVDKVSQHPSPILHKGNKVLVMIDCITSKSRVALQHVTEFGGFLTQNRHGRAVVTP